MLANTTTRFKRKTKVVNDCWVWNGTVGKNGYGKTTLKSVHMSAHTASYKLFVGDIPKGLHLDHLCRNKLCVNPSHLEPVTPGENVRRHYAHQTHCKHGHKYTLSNTYFRPSGRGIRGCRKCRAIASKKSESLRRSFC